MVFCQAGQVRHGSCAGGTRLTRLLRVSLPYYEWDIYDIPSMRPLPNISARQAQDLNMYSVQLIDIKFDSELS